MFLHQINFVRNKASPVEGGRAAKEKEARRVLVLSRLLAVVKRCIEEIERVGAENKLEGWVVDDMEQGGIRLTKASERERSASEGGRYSKG